MSNFLVGIRNDQQINSNIKKIDQSGVTVLNELAGKTRVSSRQMTTSMVKRVTTMTAPATLPIRRIINPFRKEMARRRKKVIPRPQGGKGRKTTPKTKPYNQSKTSQQLIRSVTRTKRTRQPRQMASKTIQE